MTWRDVDSPTWGSRDRRMTWMHYDSGVFFSLWQNGSNRELRPFWGEWICESVWNVDGPDRCVWCYIFQKPVADVTIGIFAEVLL